MRIPSTPWLGRCVGSLVMSVLASCHHGGSGGEPAVAKPVVSVSAGMKSLRLSWSAVAGATSYRVHEAPDGSAFMELARDVAGTEYAVDVSVHRFPWTTAQFRVDACDGHGCTASDPVRVADRMLDVIGYFKASNPGRADLFGYSVALSADGGTLAVGAIYESSGATGVDGDQTNDSEQLAGAVYVFARAGGTWAQQSYLKPSVAQTQGWFGYAVALSADGSTLAVGAPMRYGSAYESGGVWVFARAGGSWSQEAALEPSGAFESFGTAVALSAGGDTLAVGAPAWAGSIAHAGSAYLFRRDGARRWSKETTLATADPESMDGFGAAIALSADGNTLAVGEPNASHDKTSPVYRAGIVHLYGHGEAGWAPAGALTASNPDPGDGFGIRLALSGDGRTLAVGATTEASAATGVGGDAAAQADDTAPCAGAVYVFANAGSGWSQQAYVKPSTTWAYGYFGSALGLTADGDTLAVGAWGEPADAKGVGGDQTTATGSSGKGAVYVFARAGQAWSQTAYVKSSNTSARGDQLGFSVALSSDGGTLAAGARDESSAATGIDGAQDDTSMPQSGAVYLY